MARGMGEAWLDRYGGKISSEWFFPKALQILNEAPEIYAAADRLIEAADWVVWQLTGVETRNSCTAGYKAIWSKTRRLPASGFFRGAGPSCEMWSTRRCRAISARWAQGRRADATGGWLDRP